MLFSAVFSGTCPGFGDESGIRDRIRGISRESAYNTLKERAKMLIKPDLNSRCGIFISASPALPFCLKLQSFFAKVVPHAEVL
ncbi:hypothetical protein, partial [Succinimonas sp.]|uniref:hypothetical protein n=1 Tax=Succinimonas sp. TaxID=1936151 RepID=UPI00386EB180